MPARAFAKAAACEIKWARKLQLPEGMDLAEIFNQEEPVMDEIRTGRHFDRLRKRREQVIMTLRHLEKEKKQVEQNTDWLDQAAYESRVSLLDRLSEWYTTEIDQIDKTLSRIKDNKFGLCAACHEPVEAGRLEVSPEAEFCGACQAMREELQRAQ